MIRTRIIRVPFSGPRHDRLNAIWDHLAATKAVDLEWFDNTCAGLSHAESFAEIWEEELYHPSRYLLLTEHDFLPALDNPDWIPLNRLCNDDLAFVACQYHTRNPHDLTKLDVHPDKAGGWFLLIDKQKFTDLPAFAGTPDPCNQLPEQVKGNCHLEPPADDYPDHYGASYPFGTHLFWSRHLHDLPGDQRVAGVRMADMRAAHDRAVSAYIARHRLPLE